MVTKSQTPKIVPKGMKNLDINCQARKGKLQLLPVAMLQEMCYRL